MATMDNAIDILIENSQGLQSLVQNNKLPENVLARISDTAVRPYISDLKNNVHRDGITKKDYSTKEAWFGPSSFYKKSANTKIGKLGTPTKQTTYFADGYKGLRDVQGFKTDKVYLEVSGDMKNDMQAEASDNGHVVGFRNIEQFKKYDGLTKRFGNFYDPLEENLQDLRERIANEVLQMNIEAMRGNE